MKQKSHFLILAISFLPSSRSFLADASRSMMLGTNLTRFFLDAFMGIRSGWEWVFSRSRCDHRFSCAARRLFASRSLSCVDKDASGVAGVGGGDGGAVKTTVEPPPPPLDSIMRLILGLEIKHYNGSIRCPDAVAAAAKIETLLVVETRSQK